MVTTSNGTTPPGQGAEAIGPALSPQQEAYCLARAAGKNGKEAAEAAGISERTSWEYNANPAIQARIAELQKPIAEAVLEHFRGHAMRAAERVTECMEPGRGGMTGDLNLKAALAVLKFVGADSLVPTERREMTGRDGGPIAVEDSLSDDERAARIARLLDAARARRAGPAAGGE